MQQSITDLLAFAAVNDDPPAATDVDLGEVTAEVLASLDGMIHGASAVVSVGDLPTGAGSRPLLAQVMANLVSNAVKFRQAGVPAHVRIDGCRGPGAWRVDVTDDGIGVDPEFREAIFDRFRRLHRVEDYPGTGIGLAICRRLIEGQGGRIWCESVEPVGTRLSFTVPDRPRGAGLHQP
jgi:signal transduction histidine kinase